MNAYYTFHSTLADPVASNSLAKTIAKRRGYEHMSVLFDALCRKFRSIRKPRLYYPPGCWGFVFMAAGVPCFLMINLEVDIGSPDTRLVQIKLDAGDLLSGLFFRKRVSRAIEAVGAVIAESVARDGRFSDFQRYSDQQFALKGKNVLNAY